ncbi:hypothetical protein A3B21_03595 [Candidatus Uhrbacteria bacterium RIFCSPLOWO2_01_FULL_47_24]|uniref:ABC transporter permease n=1 Tax=Candidatus Uhrbacteria bacterium RIFCSPLOWO2_01_FULL_47_24 TaxID=1802401 RepID=A0A1F7UU72_9BACT|nr:MAG: hypothetical protein A2753_02650 [Candidatus Uhrbacteria bacterium RIFCSPHIGHO2_01_FULL_47_11]OGL68880.1 MAG: hypothetical protein A3D58_02965 [Candidatus Uhrbacteria bacterium RIFCSPHIGHO2_02_FULL_46_47]OGL75277.1 MAG: hypothetical protein A3F52_04395 [Candidatus Uhrbacteria bacterium RIFCSPHIGHO2_12_FULL_47_11]OGL81274.1 MAG: hypothetical protein A3B21_03595 [Candidatus Uhrbacteria bacterium RIFCSPLOWO2_01_FULL_47_24]OGL85161.1 MAG: hypothetical protein A3J03_01810 [Candidatus Uhrbact
MRRYFRIFAVLARYNFIHQTTYRPSFFFAIFGKVLRLVLFLAFADAIFRNVPEIAGWTLERIPFLILTLFVLEFLAGVGFHRNLLFFLYELLYEGKYDYILTRPVSPVFLTSFRVIDFFDILPLFGTLTMLIWYIVVAHTPLLTVFGYVILIGAAYFILFGFALILSAINFWTLIQTGVGRLYESIGRLNRFPLDVLPKFWRVALFYVVPVAVAGNIPAKFLIGTWSWWQLLYIVVFAIVIFVVAVKFWYRALRHYSSVA